MNRCKTCGQAMSRHHITYCSQECQSIGQSWVLASLPSKPDEAISARQLAEIGKRTYKNTLGLLHGLLARGLIARQEASYVNAKYLWWRLPCRKTKY